MSKTSKYFCPAPFNSVTVTATGRWALCCDSRPKYTFANGYKNIKNTSMHDWFESDYMDQIRQSMLDDKPLKECGNCYQNEKGGAPSLRQDLLKDFPAVKTKKLKIEYTDIKFGNKCNLRCKMCYPRSSSELMKEWEALGWHVDDPMQGTRSDYYDGYLEENYNWPMDKKNIQTLLEVTKTVKLLKFTGGEPMINPAMFEFLQHCVDKGHAKDIILYITTNCTKIHPKFLSLAQKFKQLNLRLSIDGIDKTYDYVRYPGDWNTTFENVKIYSTWYKQGKIKGKIYVNFVLSVFNLNNAVETIKAVSPWVDYFTIKDLTRPEFMSWTHAPKKISAGVQKKVDQLINHRDPVIKNAIVLLDGCLKRKLIQATSKSHKQLKNFVNSQDSLRKIKINNYLPEISDLFD